VALEIAKHLGVEDLSAWEVDVLRTVAACCSGKIVADRLSAPQDGNDGI